MQTDKDCHSPAIRYLLLVAVFMLPAVGPSTAFASTTSYLRPNGDITTSEPWSIVGASSASAALDDNVTALETPTTADYIVTNAAGHPATTSVDLSTLSLAGQTLLSAEAWFYTQTSPSVTLTAAIKGTRTEERQTFTGIGWHSMPIPFSIAQSSLNAMALTFTSGSESGTRQILAAFVRLTIEPPAHSIYWGAWIDGDVYGKESGEWGDAPWESKTWDLFNIHVGRAPSLIHFGQKPPWETPFTSTPLVKTAEEKREAIPLMDMGSYGTTLAEITSGARDSSLREWAAAVKNYGKPFFFRWDWEMNGTWFPWGEQAALNPEQFVKAWRHFHDIAEEKGATNITWVWCPNVLFEGSTSLSSLYPGNEYVDWTCMDGYNRGTRLVGEHWQTFSTIFEKTYKSLLSLAPSKPIIIGETASTEVGGSKASWIEDAFGTQLPKNFPGVKAVAWFNWNIYDKKIGTNWDWPVESSLASQEAFANIVSSPYYASNEFGSLTPLKPIQPLP